MQETKEDYIKNTFDDVANTYDEIPLFKISATHVADIILEYTSLRTLKVLDLACGTGNVVIECASRIPEATFDAMDISESMLTKAKENASIKNLTNIEFHLQDITKLKLDKKYNVITCSYAMFFLPNPQRILASLVAQLRPMGIIILTSFTEEAFNPSNEIVLPLLEKYGSPTALEYDIHDWKNLKSKNDIKRLCMLALVNDMTTNTKEIRYGMSIDKWWELLNNTGYKGMLMELSTEDYAKVKSEYYEAMKKHTNDDEEVKLIADTHFVVIH